MNGTVRYHRRRLADVAKGMRLARTQVSREQEPRARLASHQRQRLEVVVRHAASHSPFYRRWFDQTGALGQEPVQLRRLPVLDKAVLMEHFDELVCDPRLRRDQLLDWVGRLTGDRLYLGRYRVMVTSGSSGRPGLFVYDRAGWRSITSQVLRTTRWAGLRPSLPRQRVVRWAAPPPPHVSRQAAATLAVGLHRVLSLPVTLPLAELVEALNHFQPTYLHAYPSVAMWLADEQHAGRLQLAPQMLVTIAELRTPEMTQRLTDAFGVYPFNAYGTTEGLWGAECQHHQGIHLFEDTALTGIEEAKNHEPRGQCLSAGDRGGPDLRGGRQRLRLQPQHRWDHPDGRRRLGGGPVAAVLEQLLALPARRNRGRRRHGHGGTARPARPPLAEVSPTRDAVTPGARRRFFYYCVCAAQDRSPDTPAAPVSRRPGCLVGVP
jgi:hypothetical protein